MNSNKRNFLKFSGYTALASTFTLPHTQSVMADEEHHQYTNKNYSAHAQSLVHNNLCIDMLAFYMTTFKDRSGMTLEKLWSTVPRSFSQKDHTFIKSCGIDVFGWGDMRPSYESMMEFIATQNGIVASNPDYFHRIDHKGAFDELRENKKIGVLIANQDSKHFRTLADIDLFYGLGQRVSQLTYNGKNAIGCGAFEDRDTGLTDYGKQVVEQMNRIGMAIDVSHCGDKTTLQGIQASDKPVLITHGACKAIAKGVARAKTDEAIKAMAKTGGVIGIPILRFMIREKEPVHIDHFFDHIDHVVQLVGIEHVGIGSDQGLYTEDYGEKAWRKSRLENAPAKYQTHTNDDYLLTIEGLNHPFRTYDIVEGLIKRGYSDQHITMIMGGNFERALKNIFMH